MQSRLNLKWVTWSHKVMTKISDINITACLKQAKYNLFSKKISFWCNNQYASAKQALLSRASSIRSNAIWDMKHLRECFSFTFTWFVLCIHDNAARNCYCRFLETFTPCVSWYFIWYWKKNGLNDKSKHLKQVGKLVFNTNQIGILYRKIISPESLM